MPATVSRLAAVFQTGSPEDVVGQSMMGAARLLALKPEVPKTLDGVMVRLCEPDSPAWDDQFVIAFGPAFRVGYRPSGGTLFEGDVTAGLAWALRNGLATRRQVDDVLPQLADAGRAAALFARNGAETAGRDGRGVAFNA